jgi:hypothetical protein
MILFLIFMTWTLLLLVLKFKGSEVGCASGRAFYRPREDSSSVLSTDSEDLHSSSEEFESHHPDSLERHIGRQRLDTGSRGEVDSYSEYGSQEGWVSSPSGPSFLRVSTRERRTRSAFLAFSFVALVSVPFILVFSFGPMKEAARSSNDIVLVSSFLSSTIRCSRKI